MLFHLSRTGQVLAAPAEQFDAQRRICRWGTSATPALETAHWWRWSIRRVSKTRGIKLAWNQETKL
jgi:hypothetical protein